MTNVFITTEEVLQRYQISATTLHRWRKDRGFPEPILNSMPNKYLEAHILAWEQKLIENHPQA